VFAQKFSQRIPAEEIQSWNDVTFLDKAKLTRSGAITRTAILLLGKSESSHFINPHVAELTWKLEGEETAYEHFSPPFLLTTSLLYQRIRNIKLTLLPPGQLIPEEIEKYDQRIVLEALHNCVVHQDYQKCERILVTERLEGLTFQNAGGFFDGTPEDYILETRSPTRYRNKFLAEAMVNLRMIDTMGFGIRDVMFRGQAKRYLPLPDYDLTETDRVLLYLPGQFIDENYSRILHDWHDLEWRNVVALDRVQKGILPGDANFHRLKRLGLLEGTRRRPQIAASLLHSPEAKAEYIKNRALDDEFYCTLIENYLTEFGEAKRADLETLLREKLPDILEPTQKSRKVGNLLQKMKDEDRITVTGHTRGAVWTLQSDQGSSQS